MLRRYTCALPWSYSTVDWTPRRHKTTTQRGPAPKFALGPAPARAGPDNHFHILCRGWVKHTQVCNFCISEAFNETNSKHFSNAWTFSSLCVISCIRQSVAQKLDKIHVFYARNWNIGCKKHTANLALKLSRFSSSVLHERFISKWWLSSKIETWKFTKNKLVNSMKIDFY